MGYGIQLYSVRDLTAENLGAAMEQMSALGYESVEFAGYGNGTAEDAARYLKQYGLKTAGSHLSLSKMTPETIEETIDFVMPQAGVGCLCQQRLHSSLSVQHPECGLMNDT